MLKLHHILEYASNFELDFIAIVIYNILVLECNL